MVGAVIPVLEIEKLVLKKDGSGLNFYHDGTSVTVSALTGVSGMVVSGADGIGDNLYENKKFIPAASTAAYLKLNYKSGTSATDYTGYIPVMSQWW